MTPDRLEQIRAAAEAACPGPWDVCDANEGSPDYRPLWMVTNDAFHNPPAGEDVPWIAVEIHTGGREEAEFIAAARTDVPDLLAEVERLTALCATCCCGTSPMTYEGPEPDCPVHGAVRAFNEATHDIAQLQAVGDYLTAQLREKEAARAAVALERDEAITTRDLLIEGVTLRRVTRERDQAREGIAELAAEVEDLTGRLNEALLKIERWRPELRDKRTDLLDIRGLLSPNGGVSVLPAGMDIGERVAPAVEWLIGAYKAVLPVVEAAKAWRAGLLLVSATAPGRKANDELRTKNRMALQDAVDEWQSTHALREPGCTGLSARWCPVHGACSCTSGGEGGTHLEDPDCPLHGENSDHGEGDG